MFILDGWFQFGQDVERGVFKQVSETKLWAGYIYNEVIGILMGDGCAAGRVDISIGAE